MNPLLGRRIYLDASVLIYAIESPAVYPALKPQILDPLTKAELTLVTSWITLTEVLTKPLKIRDVTLESSFRRFLTSSDSLEILPADDSICGTAALLRAVHGVRTPDAIHIATGLQARCDHFLTGDLTWSRCGLRVLDPATL